MIWAYFASIGRNMWREKNGPVRALGSNASDSVRFDQEMWDKLLDFAVKSGINTIVMDLGEGIKYESHPEIGAKGAWSVSKLKEELKKMRAMGINPIPKLNFSCAHDEWLGDYSRCVSSKLYYQVTKDLIDEVCDIYEKPDLFHLGMDEERDSYAPYWGYHVARHGDFWWNDLYYFIEQLEKKNVRPWVWSDYIWEKQNEFLRKMPKTVMQSNWYYDEFYTKHDLEGMVNAYNVLNQNGYDQIPCGMNINIIRTVKYCMDRIDPKYLKGFFQTSWKSTQLKSQYGHYLALDMARQAKEGFYGNKEMFGGWEGPTFGSYNEIETVTDVQL